MSVLPPLSFFITSLLLTGIHKGVIYRHLILTGINSERPCCNYETVRREMGGKLTPSPTCQAPLFLGPMLVDFASVKMIVGTHARLMGTLSS